MTYSTKGPTSEIDSEDCLPWFPPLIDDAGNILPSAEKEDRQRQEQEKKRRNEIVGQTIQRPKKLKPMTAKQLSDLADSAYQDGYTAGFKQGEQDGKQKGEQAGLKQGLDESRAQTAPHRAQLQQLIDGLLLPFEGQTKQLELMLLDTVVALTKSMTRCELTSDYSHIEKLVREALLALPSGSDNISIHVHPNDLALLNDFYVERVNDWQLVSDPRITQGGCKVETKQSLVDFSVETRLQDLCKQFVDGKLMDASSEAIEIEEEPDEANQNQQIPEPPAQRSPQDLPQQEALKVDSDLTSETDRSAKDESATSNSAEERSAGDAGLDTDELNQQGGENE